MGEDGDTSVVRNVERKKGCEARATVLRSGGTASLEVLTKNDVTKKERIDEKHVAVSQGKGLINMLDCQCHCICCDLQGASVEVF